MSRTRGLTRYCSAAGSQIEKVAALADLGTRPAHSVCPRADSDDQNRELTYCAGCVLGG